ncbi:MAG: hypothetical protein ACLQT7_06980 [Candidatus Dormibacteria bacterium]
MTLAAPRRQIVVMGAGAVTALLASALPLHGFGIVVVVALAGLDVLLLQATGWLAFRRGSRLDERQTALRDLAYRRGFRWIGMAVVLLWLVWFLSWAVLSGGSGGASGASVDSGIPGRVLVAMAELLIMLPTCVIAWRGDAAPEAEGVAAGWEQTRHRGWAPWLLLPALVGAWLLAVTSAPLQSVPHGSISVSGGATSSWTCHEFGGGTMIGAEFGATVGLRAYVCWNGTDAFVWGDPNLPLPAELNRYFRPFTAHDLDPAATLETACGLDNIGDFAAVGPTTCTESIDAAGSLHYTVTARVSPLPFGIGSRRVTVDLVVTRDGRVLKQP